MLKAFFISFLIVTVIAFVILVILIGKFVVEHGLSSVDYEEIQNAIDNGDFLVCFIDNWATAIEIAVVINIVLAILSLL